MPASWAEKERINILRSTSKVVFHFGPRKRVVGRPLIASFDIPCPKAEFLDEIQTNVWSVVSLLYSDNGTTVYSFALRFIFFKLTQLHIQFLEFVTLRFKGERGKPDSKPYPLPYGLRKACRKPQAWELSRLCSETWTKLYVHKFGFPSSSMRVLMPKTNLSCF